MEVPTPLSLSAVVSLFICLTSCGLATLITWKRKSVVIESIVGRDLAPEKKIDRHGGSTGPKVFIPDVLARWPWHRRMNPNYSVVKKEADTWINSFKAFGPNAQGAFNRCDFTLFVCLAYPTARKEHLKAACELMHLFAVIDEYSERSTPSEVRMQRDVILDALRNPHMSRPEGEWVGGEMARQFWELAIQNATAISQRRFLRYMNDFLDGFVQESIGRVNRSILSTQNYMDVRRRTNGTKPSFSIIELGLDIPDEVMSHPTIQEMVLAAGDIAGLQNDIFSYNIEQHRGDDIHNIITCVMNEHNADVNGAIMWVENYLFGVEERFYAAFAALPRWEEPLNSQVKQFCDGLGQWVRAHDEWSFESMRYFGDKGLEIKEKRWVSLLPKGRTMEIGPTNTDGSLL